MCSIDDLERQLHRVVSLLCCCEHGIRKWYEIVNYSYSPYPGTVFSLKKVTEVAILTEILS